MATTAAGLSLTTPRLMAKAAAAAAPDSSKAHPVIQTPWLNHPWVRSKQFVSLSGRMCLRPVAAAPEGLTEKVAESIKNAEEACTGDAEGGECAAAWDEVEELSAAASHARDKKKEESDPLEKYCKDNPETDECRTYDN